MTDEPPEPPPFVIHEGDCIAVMAGMPAESVDAVVCDPPYALPGGFMGQSWDAYDGREDAGFGYWLSGLIDGEGHFAIKQHSRGSHAPAFGLKLRADDLGILQIIQRHLGIGTITTEDKEPNPMARWNVHDKAGCQRLVDLLDKYPLRAKKRMDYRLWREAVCEWTDRPRGNRWAGPADNSAMESLRDRLMVGRKYVEPPWSGHEFQDWCRLWAVEAQRVLRPGGHLLAFGGTRTYHRMACGVEDAGFEVRDSIHWLYGSGFPKSLDVSKAIDGAAGAEREVISVNRTGWSGTLGGKGSLAGLGDAEDIRTVTAPATKDAQRWAGWGTALKPGHEPIIMARKPLVGTVAANVVEHGTGGLNIDGCRVDASPEDEAARAATRDAWRQSLEAGTIGAPGQGTSLAAAVTGDSRVGTVQPDLPPGRWPANLILSHSAGCEEVGTRKVPTGEAVKIRGSQGESPTGWGSWGRAEPGTPNQTYADEDGTETIEAWRCVDGCPVAEIDRQSGESQSRIGGPRVGLPGDGWGMTSVGTEYEDEGGASRFFYVAKPSRAERNRGLSGFAAKRLADREMDDGPGGDNPRNRSNAEAVNFHPTVKPVDLMRYLCRLVTPPGGIVLDPFAGSGTCGIAAVREGMRYIGIEQDPEFVELARARIGHAWEYLAEPQSLFG